ncbi:hypothetical protein HK414_03270 [Ramlibacter terrae]|uniref:Uncharacterized protein n=1 Tax=Ramlibacter terrae TaxID=2732511 RepID=A0ABX6P1F7_9BURK|nr:hypothetical protein HK414_03270 [Ramlibacter terrae]
MGKPIDITYSIVDNSLRARTLNIDTADSKPTYPAAVEMFPSIVNMQAYYGKDTDNNGTVDARNRTAPTTNAEWLQVIAVRLAVVARSTQMEKEDVTHANLLWDVGTSITMADTEDCTLATTASKCLRLKIDHRTTGNATATASSTRWSRCATCCGTHDRRPQDRSRASARRAQRGISLLFSLMALVIIGPGAVALTRSVDTGTLVMGNLSFKQDAVTASSNAAEEAIAWLAANNIDKKLEDDIPEKGYYASAREQVDPLGTRTSTGNKLPLIDWEGNDCAGVPSATYTTCDVLPVAGTDVNGNKVKWVITRLCKDTGTAGGSNYCTRPAMAATSTAVERGELQPGGRISRALASPFYRVIVRVQGPRNTTSFTESLVHF